MITKLSKIYHSHKLSEIKFKNSSPNVEIANISCVKFNVE